MARPPSRNPTELELELLQILWDHHPRVVAEIREQLCHRRGEVAYTSVAKILGIMVDKGYLSRTKTGREYAYSPLLSAEQAQSNMLEDLLSRVFGGSPSLLLNRLMSMQAVSDEELEQLRAEIRDHEEKAGEDR